VRNINIAEAGTTVLEWGIPNVALVARLRCDVVLMEFCTNDFQRLTLAEADTYTTTVINTIKAARSDVHIFLMTMNPIFVTAGNGMPAGNPAKLVTQHQQYRTIAARENVGLIDNEPLWAGYVNETIIPDGVHPLETGTNAVLVPSVISALRPLLLTSS
jgi:hypothetical protein